MLAFPYARQQAAARREKKTACVTLRKYRHCFRGGGRAPSVRAAVVNGWLIDVGTRAAFGGAIVAGGFSGSGIARPATVGREYEVDTRIGRYLILAGYAAALEPSAGGKRRPRSGQ